MGTSKQPTANEKLRFVFRFRLWMLFILFVPAAIYAKRLSQEPGLAYMESRSRFYQDSYHEILFSRLPGGTAPLRGASINSAYQSQGVSFSCGTPPQLENLKTSEPALAQITIKVESGESIEQMHPACDPPPVIPSASKLSEIDTVGPPKISDYIGISGYPFKFANAQFIQSACVYRMKPYAIRSLGYRQTRFQGPMTIWFHQPNSPNSIAGVHRVGFYAARLNDPETVRVKLYTPTGRLIGHHSNIGVKCVFMGFESKYPIGWVELEAIGTDEDYALGNLIFDETN